jgi:hypothetical protein
MEKPDLEQSYARLYHSNMVDDPGEVGTRALDRRSGPRKALDMWVEEISEGSSVFRRAGNVSRGGLYLDQTIPIAIGSQVTLRFTLPGDRESNLVTVEIVSIATQEALGMSVKFIDIDPSVQARIDAYLARADAV